jgi:hypothetical protein
VSVARVFVTMYLVLLVLGVLAEIHLRRSK